MHLRDPANFLKSHALKPLSYKLTGNNTDEADCSMDTVLSWLRYSIIFFSSSESTKCSLPSRTTQATIQVVNSKLLSRVPSNSSAGSHGWFSASLIKSQPLTLRTVPQQSGSITQLCQLHIPLRRSTCYDITRIEESDLTGTNNRYYLW